jgi:hypothetical protein
MCWSGEASAAIAIAGLSSAYFLKRKGEPKEIYLPTAYFVLMEGLQAVTYTVVGECGNPSNVLLTRLAILHISFQPFFVNMLGMEFVDEKVKKRIQTPIYLMCGVVAALCLGRLLPLYDTFGRCELGTAMCSHTQTCAYRGEWHIGWDILLNGLNAQWRWYVLAAFVVPVLYGSWKWSLYHYLVGPLLASLTTTDVNERPAVWCLFSTCIIALLVNTRAREWVKVKKWPTWRYILGKASLFPLWHGRGK